jgi:hypothetical protein
VHNLHIRLADGEVLVDVDGETVSAPLERFANGQHDAYVGLRRVAEKLAARGAQIAACASCAWFRFSGMSRDMSNGSSGYCGLVGFRSSRGVVTIDHGCGEHVFAEGWPHDDEAAWRERQARTQAHPRPSRDNAFEGCMLGLAIGDAFGFPCEFRRRTAILESFGAEGVTELVAVHDPRWPERPFIAGRAHPPGTYSDDTQMTLAVADALVTDGEAPLDELMSVMAGRFVDWSTSPDNDRAPGASCMRGCEALAPGGRVARGRRSRLEGLRQRDACRSDRPSLLS